MRVEILLKFGFFFSTQPTGLNEQKILAERMSKLKSREFGLICLH